MNQAMGENVSDFLFTKKKKIHETDVFMSPLFKATSEGPMQTTAAVEFYSHADVSQHYWPGILSLHFPLSCNSPWSFLDSGIRKYTRNRKP